ncbi:glycerol-3-phosphate acyltransferase [Deinococcus sp. QL22]|uniref:glycerol-3-phosphate acyltransferase n=1 Tax=Deinococcus sp. QL22 TaxID=2939437 RepID=UPI0020172144|nr:glycerol-3-phosphate acyltransferase [Deinococcus sp. QL22]UQN07640.1 glycerol-3-phosphate acyltransferase [Deinococcus sp. QL22]
MPVLIAAFAYLLGSLVAGILYSRALGQDIRDRDLPGGSGTVRQYGRWAGIAVTLADTAKGLAAVWLTQLVAPEWTAVAAFFVVLGHCYPVFFGFRGGVGIGPFMGALLAVAPVTILGIVGMGLVIMPLYKATLQQRLKLNAVPFATVIVLPLGVLLALRYGGLPELLAGAAAMTIRTVHLMIAPPVRPGGATSSETKA